MTTLNDEEVLERGHRAASLLNHADMMSFLGEYRNTLLECIGNTQPQESKTRDGLYYQHHALGEFIASLQQYVQAGLAVIQKHEAAIHSEDAANDEDYSD